MPEPQKNERIKLCWPKEPFCGLSHGLGVLLSVVGLIVLLISAQGRPWHMLSFAIYGISLIVLYTASTLYHSLHVTPRGSEWLQRFDHSAIFGLIVGSYVPVCLILLPEAWGWSLLAIEVGLGAIGIATSLFWKGVPHWIRVVLYCIMGWLVVIALIPLRAALPPAALFWLLAGGIVYSIGTVIFAVDRPHLWPGKFSAHDLWHIFVLGGSVCHFIVMFRFIAPLA